MKNDMQNKLLEFIYSILQQTKELASQEVPEVFKEWIKMKIAESAVDAIVFTIFLVMATKIFRVFLKKTKEDKYVEELGPLLLCSLSGLGILIFSIALCCQMETIVKASIAPRAYLLESFMPSKCGK